MPHTALCWQLAVLAGAQLSVQGDKGPVQLTLIRISPLAAVQQGVPIGFQQWYEVFRHHRCSRHCPRHRQIEASSQRPVMACAFDAIGSHADPVTQSQVVNHGLDCSGLAADGIQQRHPGAGHGDGHSQSWKSAPGAHINGKPALNIISIDKEPLELKKEIPGFVVNRLQGALLSEAFNLVKDGISTAEDIDKAISQGLGLRWSFMGPFQTIHLNAPEGIAGYVERYEKMYKEMFNKPDMDWSSVVKLGLEEELLNLYQLSDREKQEKERDDKLTKLFLHKIKP